MRVSPILTTRSLRFTPDMRALPPLTAVLSGSVSLACRSRACSLRAARLGTSSQRPHLAPASRAPLRCFAAQRDGRDGRGGGEKSWSELLSDAKDLVSNAAKKVLPTSLVKKKEEPQPPARILDDREPDFSALLKPVFGDGLLGKAAGAFLGAGIKAVAGAVKGAAAESSRVQEEAAALIESDPRVAAALGGPVRCGSPFAVSSSSQSINGVSSTSTSMQFMVEGSTGRAAPVEVQSSNGRVVARVRLNSGDVVLSGGPGGGGGGGGRRQSGTGNIIDVDDYTVR